MKKILNSILVLMGIVALASCTPEAGNDFIWDNTDADATVLEAFSSVVQREGDMTIVGKNLQNVKAVIFPVDVRVEEITRESNEKILVKVPYAAETGKLILELANGELITSVTDVTYTDVFTAPTINMGEGVENVRAGDVITLEGDYLYNVASVTFMSGVTISTVDNVEQVPEITRNTLKVVVPREAQSGQIKIADADGINVYSTNEVVIRQPQILKVSPTATRPGNTITINGKDVDLIESVSFADGSEAAAVEVVDASNIKVEVTATATNGPVKGVSYAGFETTSIDELVIAKPENVAVAAERFKAGETLTIGGVNLDLVASLSFGDVAAEFTYDGKGTITTTIPATAVNGPIKLTTSNGTVVETEPIELVVAVVTGITPTNLMAGESITVSGSDLDLITGVKINGVDHEFSYADGAITIATTATSQAGKVVLSQANGVKVEPTEDIVFTYDSLITINSMPASAAIGDEVVIEGANFMLIESIYLGEAKVTSYTRREDTVLGFIVPENVETGRYSLTMNLYNGDQEISAQQIELKGAIAEIVIAADLNHDLGYSWGNAWQLYDGSKFAAVPLYGATLKVDYELSTENNYWQIQLNDGTWAQLPSFPGNEYGVVAVEAGTSTYAHALTTEDLAKLNGSGLVIGGCGLIIKKIYITYETSSNEPILYSDIVLMDYEQHGDHNGDWDGSWGIGAVVEADETGNHYIRTTADGATSWLMNCNHQANQEPDKNWVIDEAANYCMKVDVKIIDGESSILASSCDCQPVINGWQWINAGFLPDTTNGKWVTLTYNLSDWGMSGALDFSAKELGFAIASPCPAGLCMDNLRISRIQ